MQGKRLTRVYANGQSVVFYSDTPEFAKNYSSVEHWQEYNSTMRFGCALFIDGTCVYRGYLTPEEAAGREESEKLEMSQGKKSRNKDMPESDYNIVSADFPLRPEHINTDKHFWGAFDNNETEVSANWLIQFAQARGKGWEPFAKSELDRYCRENGHKGDFRFNRLIEPGPHYGMPYEAVRMEGGGWIVERDNKLHFTDDFIQRCVKASPSKAYKKFIKG